jgi:hypothetical protein
MTFVGWEEWFTRRTPAVRERIERLNPKRVPGTAIRGYHPHKRSVDYSFGHMSFRMVFAIYGREAWDKMPACEFVRSGKRRAIRIEALQDCLWMLAADHPVRRAIRHKDGMWEIPET